MLKLAIEAQLPLVAVNTRDTLNLLEVLKALTGKTPQIWTPNVKHKPVKNALYVYIHNETNEKVILPYSQIYEEMVASENTLILVNPPKIREPMFYAGEVPVPKELLMSLMEAVVSSKDRAKGLMLGLGGCTIKEAAELARLTMARDNSLTARGLMDTRKTAFQASKGLTQVDLAQDFYEPPEDLEEWVSIEKTFFLSGKDPRLIPRGLLLDGPPGVGKTAASKWLAQEMGVPLYRVDIGGTKNKYVGESENNMLSNLARLDNEEPCIALLDEIEKVFATSNNDSSGTTSTMLSQLLWWLAERRSRVLVVMTTNNAKALPRELYREGRIDKVMWFGGLEKGAAFQFVCRLLDTFDLPKQVELDLLAGDIVHRAFVASKIPNTNPETVSHAALTTATYEAVKASSSKLQIPLLTHG